MKKHPKVQTIKKTRFPTDSELALTVVIPTRNISGPRIKNCVKSLELQNLESFTTIIADYGSSTKEFSELVKDLKNFDCTIYRYQTDKIWSLSIARNIGLRRATGKIVVTVDADLLLEQNVLSTVTEQYEKGDSLLIVSSVCNIDENVNLEEICLPKDYETFRKFCKQRWGIGGVMSAPREWWHRIRGFDERMTGWGVEDDDVRKRAKKNGISILDIQGLKQPHIKVYHQWHPKYSRTREYKDAWRKNFEIFKKHRGLLVRNDDSWGLYEK